MSVKAVSRNPGGGRKSKASTLVALPAASGRKGGAFTLVELLVVVAIIAVLVTILMPTLGGAMAMARKATCSTNHRVICRALQAYNEENGSFPYNYAAGYQVWVNGHRVANYDDGNNLNGRERWALGCLGPYVGGKSTPTYLRGRVEGQFPQAYVCPAADLDSVYGDNATDMYHACYWTNICIRANRGFNHLFNASGSRPWQDANHDPMPPGWDGDSGGPARLTGARLCPGDNPSWRSVYNPTMQSVPIPSKTVFTGDTNNQPVSKWRDLDGNEWEYGYRGVARTFHAGWFTMWTGYATSFQGGLGFDRHRGALVMGYVDGSVRSATFPYLMNNYSKFGVDDVDSAMWNGLTGDFLIEFPPNQASSSYPDPAYPGGWNPNWRSRIHNLPEPVCE